jgi:ATP-dependent exoDNAse (exonuclease V) beta subunit
MIEKTRKDGSVRFELSEISDVLTQWKSDLPLRWMSGSSAYDIARLVISIMGVDVDEYVEYLLDQLSQKSQIWGYYPSELVRWWDKAKTKLCINSQVSAEAVQIMTVHRSKGLEFPIVIYPRFATKKPHQQIWVPVNDDRVPIKDAMLRFSGGAPKYYHPDAFSEEFEESVLDDLNLMYVAQTRAVQRLYIIQEDKGGVSEGPKTELNWEAMITHLLVRLMQENGTEKSEKKWIFGEDHVAVLEKREEKEVLIEELDKSEKSRAIRIRYSATKRQLGEKFSGARKKGELYHAFLQALLLNKKGEDVLEYLNMRGFQWTSEEMDALKSLEIKMMAQGQLTGWQSLNGRWFIEQPLLLEQSGELRPDAFCVDDEKVILIDFKTGKKKTEHQEQVANYIRVLTDIWKRPVKGYLFYTEDLTCIEI